MEEAYLNGLPYAQKHIFGTKLNSLGGCAKSDMPDWPTAKLMPLYTEAGNNVLFTVKLVFFDMFSKC